MPTNKPKSERDVRSLARDHCPKAINVLSGIMNSDKAHTSTRVAAARTLLAYGYGTPAQTVLIGDATHTTHEAASTYVRSLFAPPMREVIDIKPNDINVLQAPSSGSHST